MASRIYGERCGGGSSKSLGQSADFPSGTPYGCGIAPMKAILLAGGIGSRLRPITATIPKCLMPIHGQPLLDIWLEQLTAYDIGPFLVNTHHLPSRLSIMSSIVSIEIPLLWPMSLNCLAPRGRCGLTGRGLVMSHSCSCMRTIIVYVILAPL